jgi:hypothetical protein
VGRSAADVSCSSSWTGALFSETGLSFSGTEYRFEVSECWVSELQSRFRASSLERAGERRVPQDNNEELDG